jgi:hypothetical protein
MGSVSHIAWRRSTEIWMPISKMGKPFWSARALRLAGSVKLIIINRTLSVPFCQSHGIEKPRHRPLVAASGVLAVA